MPPISVILITKNAAAHIERALRSVAWADERIVVDCGSDDATVTATETVAAAPVEFWVRAQGELKAAKATPLRVPGQNFARRQLVVQPVDAAVLQVGQRIVPRRARQLVFTQRNLFLPGIGVVGGRR